MAEMGKKKKNCRWGFRIKFLSYFFPLTLAEKCHCEILCPDFLAASLTNPEREASFSCKIQFDFRGKNNIFLEDF